MATLPTIVDFRSSVLAVENQGNLGSCTANAAAAACEMILKSNSDYRHLSRLFTYYESRNPPVSDTGASLKTVIEVLKSVGTASEELWPYKIANYNIRPPIAAYSEAMTRLLGSCDFISIDNTTIDTMKSALAEKYPVYIGIMIDDAFKDISGHLVSQSHSPWYGTNAGGGHALLVVGYDDALSSFIVLNSWGLGWGDSGYCLISYAAMKISLMEAWVIKSIDNKSLKPVTIPIENFGTLSYIGLLVPYTNTSASSLRIASIVVTNDFLHEFSLLNTNVILSSVVAPGAQLRVPFKYTVKQSKFTYPDINVTGTYF